MTSLKVFGAGLGLEVGGVAEGLGAGGVEALSLRLFWERGTSLAACREELKLRV
jgi:hypothetical protein